MSTPRRIDRLLGEVAGAGAAAEPAKQAGEELGAEIRRDAMGVLRALVPVLRRELEFAAVERMEEVLKRALRAAVAGGVTTAGARELARLQQTLGFLVKKKPYAIKASSPLGYSVFLQEPGQGFSFQRHLDHKVEVFHILEVRPGGFVFICESEEWERLYEPAAFAAWLAGGEDARYEPFRHRPSAGDVIVLDRLGIVHTVLGCVLEEFATVSTDMVERLHDQNDRTAIPARFTRAFAEREIGRLAAPEESRLVGIPFASGRRTAIARERHGWGSRTRFADTFVRAALVRVAAGAASDPAGGDDLAASLAIRGGAGALHLEAGGRATASSPSVPVAAGDLLLVPPGCGYRLAAGGGGLVAVEHRIGLDVAFGPMAE